MAGATRTTPDRTYYDTSDLRLTTSGVELWRDSVRWRAVFPTGREVDAAADSDAVPAKLGALLVTYVAERKLAPCAPVTTERDNDGATDGASSVADVLSGYLREQIDAMRAADVALRLAEPEAVHDLRVAVRRLRGCLRVYGRYFVAKRVKPVVTELAWLSKRLGVARDAEVLRQQIAGPIQALPADLVLGPVRAEMDRLLARPEAEAMESLRRELNGRRYLALHDALDQLRSDPPCRARARQRADKALPHQIAKAHRKARAAVERVADGPGRDAALHGVRKKVRRLRYACEVAEPAVGKRAAKLARRSKKIQSVLGDHHDAVVARPVLRRLGAAAHLDGGNGFTFGVVHGLLDERAARLESAFARRWRRLEAHHRLT
ncbi:MAG TPA: CHAD domain-containing protein [Pseudonocardiaceae bacterium]|jgi:CHAD domain-containing protein